MNNLMVKLTSTIALGVVLGSMATTKVFAADVSKLAADCANCHGENGISSESDVPTIGGFSDIFFIDTMAIYADEGRPCPETEYKAGDNKGSKTTMCKIAADLSEKDIEALGEFYMGITFVPAKQEFDAAKAEKGKKLHKSSCKKCHEDGGTSQDDDAGYLGGQWMPYLTQSFAEYQSGDRDMPKKMKPKMKKLTDTDIDNLIHYYGSLQ